MSLWHTCSYYCVGDLHAIPVLTDPSWDKAEALTAIRAFQERQWGEAVVDLVPAREADVAQWLTLPEWRDGAGQVVTPPPGQRPWLALVRTTRVPRAPG